MKNPSKIKKEIVDFYLFSLPPPTPMLSSILSFSLNRITTQIIGITKGKKKATPLLPKYASSLLDASFQFQGSGRGKRGDH